MDDVFEGIFFGAMFIGGSFIVGALCIAYALLKTAQILTTPDVAVALADES